MPEIVKDQTAKFVKFVIVGLIATLIDVGVLQLLIGSGADPYLARAVSIPVAMVAAWQMNRHFTFGASGRRPAEEALRYAAVASLTAGVNYAAYAALVMTQPAIPPAVSVLIATAISMWVSFVGQQLFAFRRITPAEA